MGCVRQETSRQPPSRALRAVLRFQLPPEQGLRVGPVAASPALTERAPPCPGWTSRCSAGSEASAPPSKQRTGGPLCTRPGWGGRGVSRWETSPSDSWESGTEPRKRSLPFLLVLGTRPCRQPFAPISSHTDRVERPFFGLAGPPRLAHGGARLGPHKPP